jgi:hypothetical protein
MTTNFQRFKASSRICRPVKDSSIRSIGFPSFSISLKTAPHPSSGVADSRYESMAESPESSLEILQSHTSIQQRPSSLVNSKLTAY